MSTDDLEPLRRYAKTGDESAFAELVQRYLKLVYFAALRQVGGDTHRAEDVTQTVFTLLARKASSLTQHQSLAGWLHTTTRFSASKATRTERRRIAREQEAHTMHELTTGSTPDDECDRLRPVLDEVLGELSAPDREAVLLRFFASLSFAEVGAKLHVAENAARMRVDRALDKMRAQFAERGRTSTTAAISLVLAKEAALAAPHGLAASVTGAALASAGTGALTTLNLLQALATAKFTVGAAALLTLLSVGLGVRKVHASHKATASLAAAQQRYDALRTDLRDAEQRARNAENNAARLRRLVDAARTVRPAAATPAVVANPAPNAPAAWDPVAEGKAYLAAHPDVMEAWVNDERAKVKFRYGPLDKTLGLTPAQTAQFEDLMAELGPGLDSSGPRGKGLVFRSGTGMAHREAESRLRDLLGAERYRQFEEPRRELRGPHRESRPGLARDALRGAGTARSGEGRVSSCGDRTVGRGRLGEAARV